MKVMVGLFLGWILWCTPVFGDPAGQDASIFQAMEQEMTRSLSDLKLDVFNPPYFINYQIRHHDRAEVSASFGALIHSDVRSHRTLYVDVRVGDSAFDSSVPSNHRYSIEQFIPVENDLDSIKRALWYETDLRYKQAIMSFLKKKGRFISGMESHEIHDFSKGDPPQTYMEPVPEWNPDRLRWEKLVKEVSSYFKNAPEIEKSRVKIFAERSIRYYYDSEGNKIRNVGLQYGLVIDAWVKSPSGHQLYDQDAIYVKDPEQFPSRKELAVRTRILIDSLIRLKNSAEMEPYIGPAIFSPDAAAVLFHEAIGHRLEGDRLRHDDNGRTFLKKIGQRILPEFITVVDNPDMKSFKGTPLIGHYHFDDEGQKSQEVVLIDHGVLKNFLLSRSPVLGFNKTNGHARGDGIHSPMSRMSNFIVHSERSLNARDLKRRLIDEVQRQGKPFGLFVKKIIGGETQTDNGQFQVFKGKPIYLFKVYPDGREELVRGVDFVGTPLSMTGKILATGQDPMVINGFCTAESGVLPVTSITPSILLSEVELQAANQSRVRRPIMDPPSLTQ